jgi:hypothetical protein
MATQVDASGTANRWTITAAISGMTKIMPKSMTEPDGVVISSMRRGVVSLEGFKEGWLLF